MAISLAPFSVLWPNHSGATVSSLQQTRADGRLRLVKGCVFPVFSHFAYAADQNVQQVQQTWGKLISFPKRSGRSAFPVPAGLAELCHAQGTCPWAAWEGSEHAGSLGWVFNAPARNF